MTSSKTVMRSGLLYLSISWRVEVSRSLGIVSFSLQVRVLSFPMLNDYVNVLNKCLPKQGSQSFEQGFFALNSQLKINIATLPIREKRSRTFCISRSHYLHSTSTSDIDLPFLAVSAFVSSILFSLWLSIPDKPFPNVLDVKP
jgi:hypothetical protein